MAGQAATRARGIAFYTVAGIATLLTTFLTIGSLLGLIAAQTPDSRIAFFAHLPWLGLCYLAAFAAMLRRPARKPAAWQQAAASAAAMYLGGLLAGEPDPVFYVSFGVLLLALALLHPDRRSLLHTGPAGMSPILLPLALIAAAPLTVYATRMLDLHASTGEGDAFYLGIAVAAFAVPLVGIVAGLRAPGYRLPLWAAGLTLMIVCLASLIESDGSAAMPVWAATAGLLGGALFVAAGEWERRRAAATGAEDTDAQIVSARELARG
ncbi:hypothetical protein GA0074695_4238 [Micromonospora viridifaciens]|uniref:Uncharacterized protein n=1 Tax=Micromonospora viridifaciens TaxID=1881 RepID=A0A1C4YG18_MICVI|nr:hypothetical protein [Micromonospora viridifaciens]SCF19654.1 hypothetical protein GA0074695_4238 [Micromonospora viridifaciens]